mgnify:CR=1 FL=1
MVDLKIVGSFKKREIYKIEEQFLLSNFAQSKIKGRIIEIPFELERFNSIMTDENYDICKQDFLKRIIIGVNPITGEDIHKCDVFNNPCIRKACFEIYEILQNLD